MKNILVSFVIRRGIVSVAIYEGGALIERRTERVKDAYALASSYAGIIYAFKVALRHTRKYIQTLKDDVSVIFETSNSTFMKWVDVQYSKDEYQKDFEEALGLLQELPVKYCFCYSRNPKAEPYAKDEYIAKAVLGGLDI